MRKTVSCTIPGLALLAASLLPSAAVAEATVFQVRPGQRQLFLDDFGIHNIANLRRTMHPPEKRGSVIRPRLPQELAIQIRCAPAWDRDKKVFKLWTLVSGSVYPSGGFAYFESEDGANWTRPVLGQREVYGLKENNYLAVGVNILNVVYDADDPDPRRRYKGLLTGGDRAPAVSPDGLHWQTLKVPAVPSWDESNLSYDRQTRTFILTVKLGGPYGRAVHLSTSTDFEHWTTPELVFHADATDQALGRKRIQERFANRMLQRPEYNIPATYNVDVYNMGVFRYEDLYIGLPSMFHQTGKVDGKWKGFDDWDLTPEYRAVLRRDGDWSGFHHVQLACSRDLKTWQRLADRQPFIDSSPVGAGAYDTGCIIGPSSPVVRDDELWFYYTGIKAYDGHLTPDNGGICLAVLRRDGFISLDAGPERGTLLTRPFTVAGRKLLVNVEARKGTVLAEVVDADGKVLAVSEELRGNRLRGELKWRQGGLAELRARTVSLRFSLRHARFYSYWLED